MMKNTLFISIMMLALCCISQTAFAQEKADTKAEEVAKEDPTKKELIETYAWIKEHFENTSQPVLTIKQMKSEEGHEMVFIETAAAKALYDTEGKKYCTDHSELNCVEFYKLNDSALTWKRS